MSPRSFAYWRQNAEFMHCMHRLRYGRYRIYCNLDGRSVCIADAAHKRRVACIQKRSSGGGSAAVAVVSDKSWRFSLLILSFSITLGPCAGRTDCNDQEMMGDWKCEQFMKLWSRIVLDTSIPLKH